MTRQKTGGRVAGTPNKITAEMRGLAGQHGPEMLAELVRLALNADSEQTRVSACKEVLDRAIGKSTQRLEHEDMGASESEEVNKIDLARRIAHILSEGLDQAHTIQ